jgi:hypothetical protein
MGMKSRRKWEPVSGASDMLDDCAVYISAEQYIDDPEPRLLITDLEGAAMTDAATAGGDLVTYELYRVTFPYGVPTLHKYKRRDK